MRHFTTLLAVIALTIVAACGGDSDGGGGLTRDVLLTPSAGEATPEPIIEDATGSAETIALIDRINAGRLATYTARYATESGGEAGGEYIVYSLPPLARVDSIEPGEDAVASVTLSRNGDLDVACRLSGGHWECDELELDRPLLLTASPIVYPQAEELSAALVVSDGTREIAGEQADCWTITREVAAETRLTHYCFAGSGAVLFAETNSGTVRALEFSGSAEPADFALPGDP